MKLQSNFQPGIPSKAVSTLLEILAFPKEDELEELKELFQPFLRFWYSPTAGEYCQAQRSFNPS
jgi:hypothetical protein